MQTTAYEMRISDWSSDVCSSDLQLADALDEAVQRVAALHRRHARRGARHDQVACLQLAQLGEEGDHLRHLPDQLVEVALLALLSVHLQPHRAGARLSDLARRDHRGPGGGMLDRLAHQIGRSPGMHLVLLSVSILVVLFSLPYNKIIL